MAKTKSVKRVVQSTTITLPDGSTLSVWAVVEEVAWFRDEAEAKRYIATVAASQNTGNAKISEDKPLPASIAASPRDGKPDVPSLTVKPERQPPGFRMTSQQEDRKHISQLAENHVIRGASIDTTIRREDC